VRTFNHSSLWIKLKLVSFTSFQKSFPYTASIRLSPSKSLYWMSFNAACFDNQKYNCLPKYVSPNDARIRKWEVILFSVESDATLHNGSRNDTISSFVVYVGYTGREGTQEKENALFGLGHLMKNVWFLDLIEETVSLTASFYEPIELVVPESETFNRFSRSIVNDSNIIISSTPIYGVSEPNVNSPYSSTPMYGPSEPKVNSPDSSTPVYGPSEQKVNSPDSSTPVYGPSEQKVNSPDSSTPMYGPSEPKVNSPDSSTPMYGVSEPTVNSPDSSTPMYGSAEPNVNSPDSSTPMYGVSEPKVNSPDSSTPMYGSSEPNGNVTDSSTPKYGSSEPITNNPDFSTPWYFGGYDYDVPWTSPPSTVQESAIRVIPAWAYKINLETIQKELDFRQQEVVYRHEGVSVINDDSSLTISDPAYVNHFTELYFCDRLIIRADEFHLLYKGRILYYIPKDRYLFIGEFALVHDPVTFKKIIGAYVCIDNTSFEPVRGVNAGFRALVSIQAVVLMLCIHTSI